MNNTEENVVEENKDDVILDLSNIPKKHGLGKNINKLTYDWINSVNQTIKIIYNSEIHTFKIIGYDKSKTKLTLLNSKQKKFIISTNSLINKKVYTILGKRIRCFKFEINEIVINPKRKYVVLNRKRVNSYKTYTCKCLKCNGVLDILESHLINKRLGCCYCSNQRVLIGFNDIKTTIPDLIKYLKNDEDAIKYTSGSTKRIDLKCPLCSYEKNMVINKLTSKGFSCPRCSDSISYSEKFMMSLLDQLNIPYIHQLSKKHFKWCDNFLYDFYIKIYNREIIIETNGIQHFKENGFHKLSGISFKEQFDNDFVKYTIAKDLGKIDDYVELDCRKSNLNWIKEEILNSKLPCLLNFNEDDINWKMCEQACASSLVKITCNIKKNNPDYTNSYIAKLVGVSIPTVISYLKRGKNIGWIN